MSRRRKLLHLACNSALPSTLASHIRWRSQQCIPMPVAMQRKATGLRVAKACDTCRQRKERCDGEQPECGPCVARGRTCLYLRPSKKRGLREGWLHSLEKTLALVFVCCPDAEAVVLATLSTGIANPVEHDFGARWADETHESGFLQRWRRSALAVRLRALQVELDSLPKSKLPSSVDETPDAPNDQPSAITIPVDPAATSSTNVDGILPDTSLVSADGGLNRINTQGAVHLPPDALALVEQYCTHTHIWLPIIDKHQLFRLYYSLDAGVVGSSTDRSTALLLAVVHYAQLQRFHNRRANTGSRDEQPKAQEDLLHLAHLLIAEECEAVRISDAQTLLILVLIRLQRCEWVAGSIMLARASRITSILARDTADVQHDDSEKHRLPHIQRACFCLDGILSALINVPPLYGTLQSSSTHDIPVDGLEEWSPSVPCFDSSSSSTTARPIKSLSTFNELAHAIADFNNVRCSLHSVPSTEQDSVTSELRVYALDQSGERTCPGLVSSMPHELTVQLLCAATPVLLEATRLAKEELRVHFTEPQKLMKQLQEYCELLDTAARTSVGHSLPPFWPLLLNLICDIWKQHDFKVTTEESIATWAALLSVSESFHSLASLPILDVLCTQTRSRLPTPFHRNAPSTSSQRDSGMTDHQTSNTRDTGPPNPEIQQTSVSAAAHVRSSSANGEAHLPADVSTIVGLSSVAGVGDIESDVGSTAFDIMALDAMQWYVQLLGMTRYRLT